MAEKPNTTRQVLAGKNFKTEVFKDVELEIRGCTFETCVFRMVKFVVIEESDFSTCSFFNCVLTDGQIPGNHFEVCAFRESGIKNNPDYMETCHVTD